MTTWHDDDDINDEPPEASGEKPRVSFVIIAAAMVFLGITSAFAWRAYGGSPYPSFAFASSSTGTQSKTAEIDEFRAVQQQLVGQMQSNAQALAAQQAEVKRLSDQLAAVSAKIDAVQSSIASARAAIPAGPPPAAKKPATPKAAPRISTGGAPLPPPTPLTH